MEWRMENGKIKHGEWSNDPVDNATWPIATLPKVQSQPKMANATKPVPQSLCQMTDAKLQVAQSHCHKANAAWLVSDCHMQKMANVTWTI